MFGMGFAEILIIAIIAILFLGPDKLPHAITEVAKFMRQIKSSVANAKSSIDEELRLAELKETALEYKKDITDAGKELENMANVKEMTGELANLKNEAKVDMEMPVVSQKDNKPEVVTFAKKSKAQEPNHGDDEHTKVEQS